jgi:hypothetical protein
VELREVTLGGFVMAVVRLAHDCRGENFIDVNVANASLTYLQRLPPGKVDIAWFVDLMERHANVVRMTRNTGRFARSTMRGPGTAIPAVLDDLALMREVQAKLGDEAPAGTAQTLFDRSTRRQTVRASRYAKPLG